MQGYEKSRYSTTISIYLENDTRQSHSYYGIRIGNRTQAFELHHFQRLRVTSNLDFKVTPLFDAEYLRNGTTQRQGCNEILQHALLNGVISNDLE